MTDLLCILHMLYYLMLLSLKKFVSFHSTLCTAELLVNLGLENRAIASTLMNASSSRSHTVLTLYVEIQQKKSNRRATRSKLMLVDLAGSERVRRSEGQGVRLAEAKSINSSLSALGNVIAALAGRNLETHGQGRTHIPYRDTKLTKLLQDSLGGSASTALIATVGPSAVNYSETLSTLQFASRCMSVRGVAVTPSTYIDYEWMCGELREEVSMLESALARQEQVSATQTAVYDATIRQLYGDLVQSRNQGGETSPRGGSLVELFDFKKLEILIDHLSAAASTSQIDDTNVNDWFRDTDSDEDGDYLSSKSNSRPTSIVRGEMDLENIYPEEIKIEGCNNVFSNSDCNERAKIRQMEVTGMALQDPLKIEHAVKPVLSDTQETYLSTETDDTPLNTDTATIQPRVQSLSEPSKYYAHATILNPATLQKAVELNEVKSDAAAPHDVHSIPQAVSPDTTSSSRGNSRFSRTCSSDGLRSGLQSTERVSDSGRTSRGGVSGAITPSEASSILNRIASLPLDQIARMSPTAREQVLLIRSQLLGGDKVLETRGGEQSGDHSPILDVQPSRRHSSYVGKSENNFYDPNLSKSSDADRKPQPHRRPSHWQHRYRKFEEEENLISSERDMD